MAIRGRSLGWGDVWRSDNGTFEDEFGEWRGRVEVSKIALDFFPEINYYPRKSNKQIRQSDTANGVPNHLGGVFDVKR